MIRRAVVTLYLALFLAHAVGCHGQGHQPASSGGGLEVSESDGGSVVTKLGFGIQVNKGSTLHRKWIVLNDQSGPAQLSGAGISTAYHSSNIGSDYKYEAVGTLSVAKPITAYEVRFLLFDVWGHHMKTLSQTDVADLSADTSIANQGSWRAWENEVSELLTVVAFVARIRSADGQIWDFNSEKLLHAVDKIQLKLTQGELDPEKDKPRP